MPKNVLREAQGIVALRGGWAEIRFSSGQEVFDRLMHEALDKEVNRIMADPELLKAVLAREYPEFSTSKTELLNLENRINNQKNYGILKNVIENLNYYVLQYLYMNDFEILASYVGTPIIKKNQLIHDGIKNKSVEDIIGKINQQAFRYKDIRGLKEKCSGPFLTRHGELKKRIKNSSSDVKEMFLSSFRDPYKYSNQERNEGGPIQYHYEYGERLGDRPLKREYVNEVFELIKEI